MKQVLSDNQSFQISIDHERQRIYITLSGAWEVNEIGQHYLRALNNACTLLLPGFSCLADFTKLRANGLEKNRMVHLRALDLLRHAGLVHSAEIMPIDSEADHQLTQIARLAGVPLNLFGDVETGELFLDNQHSMA